MTPLAAFTVKHELMSWLSEKAVKFLVYRLSDGAHSVITDITEKIYE
jgi:hypothetical protein